LSYRLKILLFELCFISVPSTPPGNIRVTAKTSTSISLSWTAPSKDSTNGVLIGYRVHYDDNRKLIKMNANVDTSSDKTNLTLNDLGKYTNYAIKIAARTVRGPGLFSKLISVVTDEDSKYFFMLFS
jgi:chitinase